MNDAGERPPAETEEGCSITGLHHVRIPVSDAWRSRDWYVASLDFLPVLDYEEEDGYVSAGVREGLLSVWYGWPG